MRVHVHACQHGQGAVPWLRRGVAPLPICNRCSSQVGGVAGTPARQSGYELPFMRPGVHACSRPRFGGRPSHPSCSGAVLTSALSDRRPRLISEQRRLGVVR